MGKIWSNWVQTGENVFFCLFIEKGANGIKQVKTCETGSKRKEKGKKDRSKQIKTDQYRSNWVQSGQNGLNRSNWVKWVQTCQKNMSNWVKLGENRSNWVKRGQHWSKQNWSKPVKRVKLVKLVESGQNGSKRIKTGPNGSKWVTIGPNCLKWVNMG